MNLDEWFGDTGEVNSPRLKDKKCIDSKDKKNYADEEYHVNGLFSEQVFGNSIDYTCQCKRYKGVAYNGVVCEHCGVKVQSATARRFTYGHIKVGDGLYLVSPEAFKLLMTYCVTDKIIKQNALNVLIGKTAIDMSTDPPNYIPVSEGSFTGPIAFKEVIFPQIEALLDESIEDEKIKNELFPMIKHALFTSIIPVVPPDLRPITSGSGSTCFIDELNKVYMLMLMYIKFISDSPVLPHDKLAVLQQQFFILSDMLLKKLSSKSGLMRKYILGKRVDYSGRSVIVPDPTLKLQEIDVSYYLIKEIFQPAILPILAKKMKISELEAMNNYESAEYDDVIFEICKKYEGYPMIINRQPSLHRPSMLTVFIRHIVKDWVIAISRGITSPLNADFDGDQIAIYAPLGGSAYTESIDMTPAKNMFLPSNGELAFKFEEDMVLGLYKMSLTREGRAEINAGLDNDVKKILKPHIKKTLTGKNLEEFFSELVDSIDESRLEPIVNFLSEVALGASIISVSLVDYKNATSGDNKNPVSLMVDAGARGKWNQVSQIQTSRGFVSDVEGRIIPSAINSSLLHGLNPSEYFASAYGSIKGLIDTSRNTSLSGYLTRRLIYITSGLELDETMDDCGTTTYLSREITEDNYSLYFYRYFIDPTTKQEFVLTKFNYKKWLNKILYMRTPLTCKCAGNHICHKCYGLLYRKHRSRQIGYIAAQSLGERASQLTLRTKHISGSTNISLPSWCKIENGWIITSIPVTITMNPEGVIISDHTEKEEFEILYATVNVTSPTAIHEVINEMVIDEDDENIVDVESKYTINEVGKIATITIKSHDVVTAVSEFSRFLRNLPEEVTDDPSITAVLDKILNSFGFTGVHSVHYEILLSNFCRNAQDIRYYYRHMMNEPYTWIQEKNILDNSMIQSMVFEKFSQKLPKLLLADKEKMNFKGSILNKLTSFSFENKKIIDGLKETWLPEKIKSKGGSN